jgi:hypothetical protein
MIAEKHHALVSLRPNTKWSMTADGVIDWLDDTATCPTEEELQAEIIRLQAEYDYTEYQRLRYPEYPPIGDQLDALWKGGDDATEMLAKVQAVKAKYPKPE